MNSPLPKDPDAFLERFYEGQNPSPDRLAQLVAEIRANEAAAISQQGAALRGRPWHRWVPASLAAAAAVALLLLAFGLATREDDPAASTLARSLAVEIAKNHRKALPPEIYSSDPAVITNQLDRLPFAVLHPTALSGTDSPKLIGGRYCSLGGHLAVQLRYQMANGSHCTVYELSAPQEWLEAGQLSLPDTPLEVDDDTLTVSFHHQDDLLITIVTPVVEGDDG